MSDIPHIASETPTGRALVLPGGGMRVAYQAGAVQALHEAGYRYSFADGTSGGLMNLAALLSGVDPTDLALRWRTLRPTGFISPLRVRQYLKFPNLPALGDFDGIERYIFPHLGVDLQKIRVSQGVAATFNVCDFGEKTVKAIPHSDIELPVLLAGLSLPLFTPAVSHLGRTWTDAVWIRDSNLVQAVRNGANEVWVVWCIGNTPHFKHGFLNQYVHMIEMSAIGALTAELEEVARLNERISRGETPYGHTRPIVVHVIKPELPIPLDPAYVAGKVSGAALVDQGYMDAWRYLRTLPAGGVALDQSATQTPEPGRGVSFRETMSGRISFGVVDPPTGGADPNGIPLVLHATINIRDVAAFVADPHHRATMAAHLYSPRLGFTLPATGSNFQLFSPSDDPKKTEMVYELGFRRDGKDFWFNGRKAVRRGAVWNLWRDTTTLHVKIHEGRDASGPVVGAGIMRLNLFDFISLMTTLHARDCRGCFEKLGAIRRFALFFTDGLWSTYGFGRSR
jgi:predicted acylesterase/phospholipase RssA